MPGALTSNSSGSFCRPDRGPSIDDFALITRIRDRLNLPLTAGIALLAAASAIGFYAEDTRYQSTHEAFVQAARVSVSASIPGRVIEVDVDDNQSVKQGQPLFRLDDRPYQLAVKYAAARLIAARLEVEALRATYVQHLAEFKLAQGALAYWNGEFERRLRLYSRNKSSKAQAEQALYSRNAAEYKVVAAVAQVRSTLANLGGDPNVSADSYPRIVEAQAALQQALLELSATVVLAPFDGIASGVEGLQVGDYVSPGTPAFALVSTREVWIEASFSQEQVSRLQAGQQATVKLDAYPRRRFRAMVASVSPETGLRLASVPVRLELEDAAPFAQSGLSAFVTIDTGRRGP